MPIFTSSRAHARFAALLILPGSLLLSSVRSSAAEERPVVRTHDNRRPAGVLKDGTLALYLRAGRGLWRPEKETGPALEIEAFGERDGSLTAPAPLIRVPEGTEIAASVRNDLDVALTVHGLCEHDAAPCAPIQVPAGGAREVRFRSGRAGTYAYWAETTGMPQSLRFGPDSQLSGAFVVDPPNARTDEDRIFVITEWMDLSREQLAKALAADEPFFAALMMMKQGTTLLNGLSWPDTERLTYRVGEKVRWRFVNASAEPHPLHLHGFYFDVDSLGDGERDTHYAAGQKRRVVTQLVPVGGTMSLTWTPERAGNWLFHCHIIEHVEPARRLSRTKPAAGAAPDAHASHGAHAAHGHDTLAGMAGMVLGVTVIDASGTSGDPLEHPMASTPPRALTMTIKSVPNRYGSEPGYGFVVSEASGASQPTGAAAGPEQVRAPGPLLVLRRDEPVEITLVNELSEATAVHWHGMELESYYDGVHEFGGMGQRRTPLIAPGASFVVRFTPPRTGTFMYHTHMHDNRQLNGGLYGPMLVIDPNETHDPATDHTLVIGRDGVGRAQALVLNGSAKPTVSLRAGTRHRLRLANITRHDIVRVSLANGHALETWRPITKDGAPVPPNDGAPRPAEQTIAVGETYDFEFVAPDSRQNLFLDMRDGEGRWLLQGLVVIK